MSAERICPTCQRSFFNDELECPTDHVKLVVVATEQDHRLGQLIDGKFTIDALIAEGGMGAVYRATQHSMERHVAVKILHKQYSTEARVVRRFLREARSASRLNHPNVITLFDYGQSEAGELYLMMELLAGESLGELLEREGCLRAERAIAILAQVSDGLHHAHEHGMVHRDMKPDNIFVTPGTGRSSEFAKVLDFGVAQVETVKGAEALTRTGMICGTPPYMSPEQALGVDLDRRSDVYALGVVLYECLTGVRPFDNESPVSILLAHVSDPIPPLSSKLPIPASVEAVLRSALAKRPSDRPPTCLALKEALFDALESHRKAPAFVAPPSVDTRTGVVPPSETQLHRVELELAESGAPATTQHLPELAPEVPGWRRWVVAGALFAVAGVALGGWAAGWWSSAHERAATAPKVTQAYPSQPAPESPASEPTGPDLRPPAAPAVATSEAPAVEKADEPKQKRAPSVVAPKATSPVSVGTRPTPSQRRSGERADPMPRRSPAEPPALSNEIRLTTVPEDATVHLGTQNMGRAPLTLPRPRSGRSVTIVVRARGYRAHTITLDSTAQATIEVALRRAAARPKKGFIIE